MRLGSCDVLLDPDELELIFRAVAPYMTNHPRVKKFLDKNKDLDRQELVAKLERVIRKKEEGPLKTDFKILLNKLVQDSRS
jgi:hypothetical protein